MSLTETINRRVELWARQEIKGENGEPICDALGQPMYADVRVGVIWAGIVPQTGSLLSGRAADTKISRTTHKIICRFRHDISSNMWFVYNKSRYNILYLLDPYESHECLEIFCEVVV